jgi:hypothetical protein
MMNIIGKEHCLSSAQADVNGTHFYWYQGFNRRKPDIGNSCMGNRGGASPRAKESDLDCAPLFFNNFE